MKNLLQRPAARVFVLGSMLATAGLAGLLLAQRSPEETPAAAAQTGGLVIDYPSQGSLFPPDFAAPTFLWRDATPNVTGWQIEVAFADGGVPIRAQSKGELMRVGEIDERCIAPTNKLPELTPQQAASHTWTPDAATWATIKRRSAEHDATVAISGLAGGRAVSRGEVAIRTSKDPVGAPIFYRDVPLMPSETEKGVIKPLAPKAIPLIAWRLRNMAEPRSRLLLTGMHTCANCHSFSRDGKTLGMDLDGPQNDKGLYALVAVKPQMSIRTEDMISWNRSRGPAVRAEPRRLHVAGFARWTVCRHHHQRNRPAHSKQFLRGQLQGLPLSAGFLSHARHPGLV